VKASAIIAAAVAILAVVETATALTARMRVATNADWDAAAAEVRAGFKSGDLVAFAPYWADQAGRAHLGDLVTVEMAGRSDADRYARVWEVSIRGARSPDVAGATLVHESQHGKVRVRLFEKRATPIVYDFTSHANELVGDRFDVRTLEIDYKPRRGQLVTPELRPKSYEWRDVPLGDSLVVYAGLHDYYARKNADGLVDFTLSIDGRLVLDARVGNDDGWRRFEVVTNGGRHTVTMRVSAGNPAWRNFGFHMEARGK
jgi:hypothetical protein